MLSRRVQRAFTSWIATLAVLMATLAPALSHALGTDRPASWIEICTSAGTQLVSLDDGASPKGKLPGASHLLEHCPYCGLHADVFGLLPSPTSAPQTPALTQEAPHHFTRAGKSLDTSAWAQARAPPQQG